MLRLGIVFVESAFGVVGVLHDLAGASRVLLLLALSVLEMGVAAAQLARRRAAMVSATVVLRGQLGHRLVGVAPPLEDVVRRSLRPLVELLLRSSVSVADNLVALLRMLASTLVHRGGQQVLL